MARGSNSQRLDDPYPRPVGPHLIMADGQKVEDPTKTTGVTFEDGTIKVEQPDGSVVINFNGKEEDEETEADNLADKMSEDELEEISSDLLDGIARDEASRMEWLETRALGISLLGLKLEKPRSDAGASQAPLEGMSTVRHPLLLEATVSFQATARGELLPASGPIKVRNDSPVKPMGLMQTNAAQDLAESLQSKDELAQALERDLNHYLTSIATEYVPDTDRMLFYVGFGGDGFKKVYNCPLRQRPVSESVDAEDLIVSNAAVDLHNCSRITHRIRMRKSVLRRMQILGVYRDVELTTPTTPAPNPVDKKKEEIAGFKPLDRRPEDRDYEVYECYCELDIDRFAPKKFKGKGLPLPYRVTLEKESRKILDIRQNWDDDDEECTAKRYFVQFPFIRGLGFYGLGYVHLLGNTTNALTGAWRMIMDAGMFANFPGFLYAKGAGRQNSNQFRVPPGGGIGLDIGAQADIRTAIMPLPYREVGPSFTSFLQALEGGGQRIAATANIGVGEGKQEAPVGTTLALIEQATKVIDSAHKRLHAAQAEEFKLLKERFREDPEAFWRHNKRPTIAWEKQQFIDALNQNELVPVADPNNPTSLHRIAKAMAIKQLQMGAPELYDPVAVDMRVMRIVDIDPQGLFRAQPAQQPPDPKLEAIKVKAMSEAQQAQIAQADTMIKAKQLEMNALEKAKDRESRERVEAVKLQIEKLKILQAQVIHEHDEERTRAIMLRDMAQERDLHAQTLKTKEMESQQSLRHQAAQEQLKLQGNAIKTKSELVLDNARRQTQMRQEDEQHRRKLEMDSEAHSHKLEQQKELNKAKVEAARALARAKPKPKPKGKSGG